MTSNHEELRYLTSLTRLVLAEQCRVPKIKASSAPREEKASIKPSTPSPSRKPVQAPPAATIPVVEKALEPTISYPQHPLMQAMPRPFAKSPGVPLGDVVDMLKKFGIDCIESPQNAPIPQPDVPKIVFVSFFAPSSSVDEFLKKVTTAVGEKLVQAELLSSPTAATCAEIYTLAVSNALKAVIFCYDTPLLAKFNALLAHFGDEAASEAKVVGTLSSKKSLFTVPLFELPITQNVAEDAPFKSALWNSLKQIV